MAKEELYPEIKDEKFTFKMSASEKEHIEKESKKLGISMAKYVRMLVFN